MSKGRMRYTLETTNRSEEEREIHGEGESSELLGEYEEEGYADESNFHADEGEDEEELEEENEYEDEEQEADNV